jgi:hypothetical protein
LPFGALLIGGAGTRLSVAIAWSGWVFDEVRRTAAYLRTHPGITPAAADSLDRANVVLVIASQVGEGTLAVLERAAELVPDREMRFVLAM